MPMDHLCIGIGKDLVPVIKIICVTAGIQILDRHAVNRTEFILYAKGNSFFSSRLFIIQNNSAIPAFFHNYRKISTIRFCRYA